MKIAICQINPIAGDLEGNTKLILDYYGRAKSEKCDLAVFPELALTGYFLHDILGRRDFVDRSLEIISKRIIPEITGCGLIVGSVNHNPDAGKPYYNSALFIDNKEILAVINKQHLPSTDLFEEKRYYSVGAASTPISYKGIRLGISVCADMWRDEDEYSKKAYLVDPINDLGKQGVDLFINISASPFSKVKDGRRKGVIKDIVQKWNVPFIMVNTVGANDSIVFDGKSKFVSSSGNVLAEAKGFEEDLLVVDTNKETKPYVARSNVTSDIYQALVLGLRDYVRKSNLKGVVIGLSGGIDSSLCTVIAAEAVGPKNVTCVNMPTRFSSESGVIDSEKLCKNLGVKLVKFSIEDIFTNLTEQITLNSKVKLESVALENIQPRIRGMLLMAFSNAMDRKIVIASGNKSEIATGYCTLYGDTCGALALLGDVYKTQLYKLAEFVNRKREIIPEDVIKKEPSAELKPGQYDTDILPPYDVLDSILELYIEEQCSPEDIYKRISVDKSVIDKTIDLVVRYEFKRRQLPPVVRVSKKAFIVDRRWPIVHRFR